MARREVVEVPHPDDMEDDTFLKHLGARHAHECAVPTHQHAIDAWIGSYRAFHERLHAIATPDQYDHEHEEFE